MPNKDDLLKGLEELAKLSGQVSALQMRFVEVCRDLPDSKYHRSVPYFLGEAQSSIGSLVIQLTKEAKRRRPTG